VEITTSPINRLKNNY